MLQKCIMGSSSGGGATPTWAENSYTKNTTFTKSIKNGVIDCISGTDWSNSFYFAIIEDGVISEKYKHSSVTTSYQNDTLTFTCSYGNMNIGVYEV